jgi:hypothetical protein
VVNGWPVFHCNGPGQSWLREVEAVGSTGLLGRLTFMIHLDITQRNPSASPANVGEVTALK